MGTGVLWTDYVMGLVIYSGGLDYALGGELVIVRFANGADGGRYGI